MATSLGWSPYLQAQFLFPQENTGSTHIQMSIIVNLTSVV